MQFFRRETENAQQVELTTQDTLKRNVHHAWQYLELAGPLSPAVFARGHGAAVAAVPPVVYAVVNRQRVAVARVPAHGAPPQKTAK